MTRVAVVGSGNMGRVLTGIFLDAGHEVTVYDLDKSKTVALAARGAKAVDTPLEVAQNADITLLSIPTYAGAKSFLASDGVLAALKGKDILQVTTGSPRDVKDFEKFLEGTGIGYLEGRIKNYPKDVGKDKPGSRVIYSGDESLYEKHERLLDLLSEHYEFVGPKYEAAAILDLAVFPSSYGLIWGLLLGGKLVKEYGYSVAQFGEMVSETVINTMRETLEGGYEDLERGEYRTDEGAAAISTWESGAGAVVDTLDDANLGTDIFVAINALLRESIALGRGDKTIAAIAELLGKK
ncbi:NAD(P)-dependent oxidoreductase [Mycobacterium sp. CBMA293]|uniref:NAD(P)-binding domain-containing protein n=1 Tax=unclassified Mycolicibacterium TaxID=2636767 RepID=UPI0012DBDBC1|nr:MULTISPECIES: NAD(P)-binding domain-containing protein [unclassified Mycolicibacterium]MUL49876.1 NAD(P)-dependent oxidoreductase [Mycolicibacterium sp. CBMA 360]MUL62695.1 NAD(P)-dependent oxidoreductase [Mycolicibacterium sp. CBMA 335]MUL70757.1 NAD(P)-dependent oxidoreductase [Mycolicibacterium sp. CBMA 311]MUL97219.1 NAD(P)-dependent oxidoreductase [Mycolicibacterium sp. CBMA 230]MUM07968.1 hypothetical protein [Mycolicibacterium sp. CBMA 213]